MSSRPTSRLLLVEDDSLQARVVKRALAAIPGGPAVVHVANGSEALDHLKDNPGDVGLVVTDLRMPVLDGLGLLRAMKADPGLRSLPVVVLTGSLHQADVLQAYESQAVNIFQKPANLDQLDHILKLIVDFFGRGAPRIAPAA